MVVNFFSQFGLKICLMCPNLKRRYFQKFGKKSEPKVVIQNPPKISTVHRCFRENQRCSALNQRCFRENDHWFLALRIFVFSAVQRFSGNEQRWNRPENFLDQSWSALNVFETSIPGSAWRLCFVAKILDNLG